MDRAMDVTGGLKLFLVTLLLYGRHRRANLVLDNKYDLSGICNHTDNSVWYE